MSSHNPSDPTSSFYHTPHSLPSTSASTSAPISIPSLSSPLHQPQPQHQHHPSTSESTNLTVEEPSRARPSSRTSNFREDFSLSRTPTFRPFVEEFSRPSGQGLAASYYNSFEDRGQQQSRQGSGGSDNGNILVFSPTQFGEGEGFQLSPPAADQERSFNQHHSHHSSNSGGGGDRSMDIGRNSLGGSTLHGNGNGNSTGPGQQEGPEEEEGLLSSSNQVQYANMPQSRGISNAERSTPNSGSTLNFPYDSGSPPGNYPLKAGYEPPYSSRPDPNSASAFFNNSNSYDTHDEFVYRRQSRLADADAASSRGFGDANGGRKRKEGGWRKSWEPIHWFDFFLLSAVVAFSFPFGYFIPKTFTNGITLFWARVIVAVTGTFINVILGIALLKIGSRIYEACMWSTVVHADVTLRDLDAFSSPNPVSALFLLRHRLSNPSRYGRRARPYDHQTWAIFILYFLFVCALAEVGSFIYGRVVSLNTVLVGQTSRFHPLPITGDLTQRDIDYATSLQAVYNGSLFDATWTLRSALALRSPQSRLLSFEGRSIYFTEASASQFEDAANTTGAGTWNWTNTFDSTMAPSANLALARNLENAGVANKAKAEDVNPALIVWPTWGSEISCTKLDSNDHPIAQQLIFEPDGEQRIYAFIPKAGLLNPMLEKLNVSTDLLNDLPSNTTNLDLNGTLPSGARDSVLAGPWFNNGLTVSLWSNPLDMGEDGNGWSSLDVAIVRLQTDPIIAPKAVFPYTNTFSETATGPGFTVGVDIGVCITKTSPFIVEALNSTAGVTTTRVLADASKLPSGGGKSLSPLFRADEEATSLSSQGKYPSYLVAFQSSRNTFLKDNSLDDKYVPNPTLLQLAAWDTDVDPPVAFTNLAAAKLQNVLGAANVRYLMPFLTGSGRINGRAYYADTKAVPDLNIIWLSAFLGGVYVVGLLGICFVPRLPLALPHRDVLPSSWMLAFSADKVMDEKKTDFGVITPFQHLDDVRRNQGGELKLRYGRS